MSAAPFTVDFTNPALTTLFIAMVYALIRVVGYFISKKTGGDKAVLAEQHVKQLDALEGAMERNKKMIEASNRSVEKLTEMHEVFDGNRVPVWYVPSELLTTVRSINTEITVLNKEIIETMGEIKAGQTVLVDKLGDLINSQRLMTERLGDLIMKLNKMSE